MHFLIALTYQSFDFAHDDKTMTIRTSRSPQLGLPTKYRHPSSVYFPFSPLSLPFQTPFKPNAKELNYGLEKALNKAS